MGKGPDDTRPIANWLIPDHELSVEVFARYPTDHLSSRVITMIQRRSPEYDTMGRLRAGVLAGEMRYQNDVGKKTMAYIHKVVLARVVP